jgi:hypothetical protein
MPNDMGNRLLHRYLVEGVPVGYQRKDGSLLPKLISGELRVPGAEKIVERHV